MLKQKESKQLEDLMSEWLLLPIIASMLDFYSSLHFAECLTPAYLTFTMKLLR
jgi:hypothetical protein